MIEQATLDFYQALILILRPHVKALVAQIIHRRTILVWTFCSVGEDLNQTCTDITRGSGINSEFDSIREICAICGQKTAIID